MMILFPATLTTTIGSSSTAVTTASTTASTVTTTTSERIAIDFNCFVLHFDPDFLKLQPQHLITVVHHVCINLGTIHRADLHFGHSKEIMLMSLVVTMVILLLNYLRL